MEFFNDLSKKFSNVAKSVTEKTKESVEVTRIASDIRGLKNEVEQLYTELGKVCYALRQGDGDASKAEEIAGRIQKALMRIEELNDQRDAIRDMKRCAGRGAVMPREARFCSSCGRRMPEDAPDPEPESPVDIEYCPDCGAERRDGEAFCSVCGRSFDEKEAQIAPEAEEAPESAPVNVEEPQEYGEESGE